MMVGSETSIQANSTHTDMSNHSLTAKSNGRTLKNDGRFVESLQLLFFSRNCIDIKFNVPDMKGLTSGTLKELIEKLMGEIFAVVQRSE